jgi:3-hydroxymyristoyl/3-hydroxydecanoyl-(acyl carrier protein) dehydratase
MKCRLTQVSAAADMIIESFDFSVVSEKNVIYEGQTTFGFFTETALTQQKGLSKTDDSRFRPDNLHAAAWQPQHLEDAPPFLPESVVGPPPIPQMTMPARALRMMDLIEHYDPQGGPSKLGYIRGVKHVDPKEWFFKAHFYQDPVWPGSLGIEAFMQLLKFMAVDKWPDLTSRYRFSLVTGTQHTWTYRGQVIPGNKQVTVEACVTRITETPEPLIMADGFLRVDGLAIYEMTDFGIRLVPTV